MSRKDFCCKMLFFGIMFLGIFQISYGIDPSVLYHLSEEGSKNSGSESASRNSPMDEDEDKDEEASNQVPRPVGVIPRVENPTSASEQTRLGREKELRYKNYEAAVKWYRKAAEQDYAEAQYHLGNCYEKGLGVSAESKLAFEYFQKAANQGYAPAQYRLAICCEIGSGVNEDQNETVKLHRKAAKRG